MSDKEELDFASKVIDVPDIEGPVHPLATPIVAASTYLLDNAAHGAALSSLERVEGKSPWLYSRWGNPTTDVAGKLITSLEGGYGTLVTSSGMAAVSSALFSVLQGGDHVVAPKPVYGGTHEVFEKVLPRYGIEVSWVDGTSLSAYREAIKNNTRVIYAETPANPTMSIVDLSGIGELGRSHNITTMVDSTFGSPYNQQPIKHGLDVVIHSTTKYLGGHSDIIGGSVTMARKELHKKVFQTIKLFGGVMSPFDAFLLIRGIKTLDVRVKRHNTNAMKIAQFLESHEKVSKVFYPGLASHPQHDIAKKQMKGFGGMIAFEVAGGIDEGKKVIEAVKLIKLAVSLGGVESLIEHAASMTHTMVSREKRLEGGITDGLIRFSVGIENVDDLIKDLSQALDAI